MRESPNPASIHWVDVFATGPLSGNPLAVITCEAFPGQRRMQRIAAELGLSETVFAVPGAPPTVRIFTPATEIPLAGHPLVGTAWVLRREGWTGDEAVIRAPGGDIPVRADAESAAMVRRDPRHVRDVDAAQVAAALGIAGTGAAPVWDAAMPQLMLPVDDPGALAPDHDRLRELGTRDGWAGISAYRVTAREGGVAHVEVRHFAAPIGIPEDPVTGSAAGALGAALAAAGHGEPGRLDLVIRQGHHMGRPGEVRVRVDAPGGVPSAVEVGGAVVPVMTGSIRADVIAG